MKRDKVHETLTEPRQENETLERQLKRNRGSINYVVSFIINLFEDVM
jgi:hypothetical protein